MPRTHVVSSGECLSKIAARYGFGDYAPIWGHPDNADLRKVRPNPNVLFPGDRLTIPDLEEKTVSCATGANHKFKLKRLKAMLRIVLRDGEGKALANEPYKLTIGDDERAGSTDGDGLLEEEVPASLTSALLVVRHYTVDLRLSDLNPITDTRDKWMSGMARRLENLGYPPGPSDGDMTDRFRAMLTMFQKDNAMDGSGEPDDGTQKKLIDTHGC